MAAVDAVLDLEAGDEGYSDANFREDQVAWMLTIDLWPFL